MNNINVQLLNAVQMTYRKHHLDDDSIGWEELGNMLLDTLCEAMGDEEFVKWTNELEGEKIRFCEFCGASMGKMSLYTWRYDWHRHCDKCNDNCYYCIQSDEVIND